MGAAITDANPCANVFHDEAERSIVCRSEDRGLMLYPFPIFLKRPFHMKRRAVVEVVAF